MVQATDDMIVSRRVQGRSKGFSAAIFLSSDSGNVTIGSPNLLRINGGTLKVAAGQTATISNAIVGHSRGGGGVRVDAPTVVLGPRVQLNANNDGNAPGLCFNATAGDLTLNGTFLAHGGGEDIVGLATGNLIANGVFRAAPGGCIALTAGGAIDTSAASFDTPLLSSCSAGCVNFSPP